MTSASGETQPDKTLQEATRDKALPELSLVIPVYNEEGAIADVVREWLDELERLQVRFELRLYDDGSQDRTPTILGGLAATEPRIVLKRHANRGHGPTILRGYREARGDWIFQTDGDGEMDTGGFADLWAHRDNHDLLLGVRRGRRETPARWLVTRVSRLSVGLLFGGGVRDVNTPYRLMRRSCLRDLLENLPDDLFAPNVALTGLAVRAGLRIYEAPVRCLEHQQGGSSLAGLSIFRPAARSLFQTVSIASRAARSPER